MTLISDVHYAEQKISQRPHCDAPKGNTRVIEIIQQHAAELIAGLSAILSAAANWRVVRVEKTAGKAQKAMRRMDMLVEVERKNAAVGKLALVTAQKILLLQQHPNLVSDPDHEVDRLSNNMALLHEFKEGEEKQRRISEAEGCGDDIDLHSKAITDIQRLRVHLEADIEKETNVYRELLDKSRAEGGVAE